jgi:hypothetical protein
MPRYRIEKFIGEQRNIPPLGAKILKFAFIAGVTKQASPPP